MEEKVISSSVVRSSAGKIFFFLLMTVYVLLTTYPLHAQQGVTLEAFVDSPTVSTDDQLVLTVRVSGANVFTEPSIPSRGNFEVLSRGSSSQVQMVNGKLSVSKEYTYVLQPLKAGEFDIGPISVFVEGVEKQTAPIHVTVTDTEPSQPRKNAPNNHNFPPPGFQSAFPPVMGGNPMMNAPDPLQNGSGQYKDVFVTAEVDNKTPYKGEQVMYSFKLYTSKGVGEAKLDLPDFHDFWSEDIQKENKYYKELDGKRYVVSEFKVALFPSKSGSMVIAPATLHAQIEEAMNLPSAFNDPFFSMRGGPLSYRPRVFKTPEITLDVKDLPSGAPAGFSGLVGQFSVQANLSKKDLSVGDSATLSIQISGSGNIKDAQIQPNFQIPGLKVYDDKPTQEIKKTASGVSGTKTFKYALVPENPGKFTLPSLEISYFDPKKGSYETLTTPSYELSVVPGTSQEKLNKSAASNPAAGDVSSLAEDIATIHTPKLLKSTHEVFGFYYWVLVLFAAPPLVFAIAFLGVKRQRWREENSDSIRRKKALSRALDRIKAIDLSQADEISPKISHILRDYLGDKFNLLGAALTPMEVEKLLLKDGKKHPAGQAMVQFMEELESWVYAGRPTENAWEKATQKKAVSILKAVEKELFR